MVNYMSPEMRLYSRKELYSVEYVQYGFTYCRMYF